MLSRLLITFLPRSKHLLISWLQSPSAVILEPPKIKSDNVSTVSPSICHEVTGLDAMFLVFWMLSFKPTFSTLLSLSSRGSFNWRLITLQYCGGFHHTLTWISHRCTCVLPSSTPFPYPPHPIPLGCPRAPALSALLHALNLNWSSILYMVIYMFQCYSLKSSHPCLRPELKSLFFRQKSLCLFCCLVYRVIITIF